jgi:hypothetical protein
MKRLVAISAFLFFLIFVNGCGITIIPRPLASTDRVNPSDRSITQSNKNIKLSVRVQDTAVGGYSLSEPITSFYIEVVNNRSKPVLFPPTNFILIDDQGKTYQTVSPAEIKALLNPAFNFFQPFPYVSILNVVDQENQRAASAMSSEQPYVGQGFNLAPTQSAFPESSILPGARAAGVVFFEVDLSLLKLVRLQVSDPIDHSVYIFPFAIE